MNYYTYVVNHGDENPAIGAETVINGGKLQAVMFDDAITKLEAMDAFLETLYKSTNCEKTRYAIDDFMN